MELLVSLVNQELLEDQDKTDFLDSLAHLDEMDLQGSQELLVCTNYAHFKQTAN